MTAAGGKRGHAGLERSGRRGLSGPDRAVTETDVKKAEAEFKVRD